MKKLILACMFMAQLGAMDNENTHLLIHRAMLDHTVKSIMIHSDHIAIFHEGLATYKMPDYLNLDGISDGLIYRASDGTLTIYTSEIDAAVKSDRLKKFRQ